MDRRILEGCANCIWSEGNKCSNFNGTYQAHRSPSWTSYHSNASSRLKAFRSLWTSKRRLDSPRGRESTTLNKLVVRKYRKGSPIATGLFSLLNFLQIKIIC